ncbi:hypothetical protein [Arthrobacter crystallopoietes]|uniref:hypothetical protein n=1 Tax=Crystallibacter crystallopoietes TaxID=37928 RepID=UPI0011113917|nr:hypothetical protein [Arthrobacter crystallopoietes]QTG80141.1 hypothetical protein J5251_14815 [Arthrobacter crystallopoietes]
MSPLGARMRGIMMAAAALCFACCGDGSGSIDGESVQLETGPNGELLVVDVSAPGDAVMEAAFEGKVMADEAGCVIGSWNHNEVLLKFPLGTRFDGADILLPNGKTIRIGEKAFFGGGYFSGEQNRGATRGVPEKCLRDETFLIQTYNNPSASREQREGSMKADDI